jgi:hypothetical protein
MRDQYRFGSAARSLKKSFLYEQAGILILFSMMYRIWHENPVGHFQQTCIKASPALKHVFLLREWRASHRLLPPPCIFPDRNLQFPGVHQISWRIRIHQNPSTLDSILVKVSRSTITACFWFFASMIYFLGIAVIPFPHKDRRTTV